MAVRFKYNAKCMEPYAFFIYIFIFIVMACDYFSVFYRNICAHVSAHISHVHDISHLAASY